MEADFERARFAPWSAPSLDLGVDFTPVDRVLQVGSPKGVARLVQRAGRSGHQPGALSRVSCVPTHAFELVEVAAARDALRAGAIEARRGVERPLDLLAQHIVSLALGGGVRRDELLPEFRTTASFRDLTEEELAWVLQFITAGGEALRAYPEYHKVEEHDGVLTVPSRMIAFRHRLAIGTIVSDAALTVRYSAAVRSGVSRSRSSPLALGLVTASLLPASCSSLRAAPRHYGVRPPGQRRARRPAGRLPDAALERTLCGGVEQAPRKLGSGLRRDEMQAVRPVLETQSRAFPDPGEGRAADRTGDEPRGRAPLRLPLRGAAGARGTLGAVRLP
ncbi:MAG: hypothetical protein U0133_06335 [Gemmatimonadales bacterium]